MLKTYQLNGYSVFRGHWNLKNLRNLISKYTAFIVNTPLPYWSFKKVNMQQICRFQAFSFLCTFVPGSEKTIERTFVPWNIRSLELLLLWNFRSSGANVPELSFRGTFAPVELSFLGSERSKNFRSYETVVSWERIFREFSFQMS